MLVGYCAVVASCLVYLACTKAQEGPAISAGIDVAACILAHYSDPVATIVLECGAQSEQDVVRILDGANAMATRKAAGLKAVAP